jgi:HK97 family phage prohead protease
MGSGNADQTRQPDFSGYVTKAGIVCTDGRMIDSGAFEHQDPMQVPFVWQHGHKDVENILGHVKLEKRSDGMYGYVYLNETPKGRHAKEAVHNGDLNSMSIWANELKEKIAAGVKHVMGGSIKEVSLCLAGANSGAKIDNIRLKHSVNPDDPEDPEQVETLQHDAFIRVGAFLEHEVPQEDSDVVAPDDVKKEAPADDESEEAPEEESDDQSDEESEEDAEGGDESADDESEDESEGEADLEHGSVQEVWDGMSDEEQSVVRYMIGVALKGDNSAAHSDSNNEGDLIHTQEGTQDMTTQNVFETHRGDSRIGMTRNPGKPASLSHSGLDLEKRWDHSTVKDLLHDAMGDVTRPGSGVSSLRKHLEMAATDHLGHDVTYGIENIDYLFPDARPTQDSPEFIMRRADWVDGVLTGVKHSPFSRVKTYFADITADEARAKGYTKGQMKKDEWFTLSKRTTGPATIYKKQKLDRDDILDITDMDVVAWMKVEMRMMLDEEIARAILVGDGREIDDEDKVKEPPTSGDGQGIRPIAFDDDVYTHKVLVATNASVDDKTEAILRARKYYHGSGSPTLYTTDDTLTDFLVEKDRMGRKLYATEADVASALRVKNIVTVEVMEGVQTDDGELVGVIVNLIDYTVGADRGAAIGLFDDFDIDFNQYKYLMETRISGALTKYKAALAIIRANGTEATPTIPTFNTSTGVLTVPTVTGVVYKNDETDATLSAGAQTAIASGDTFYVRAVPASGYYFPHNFDATWSFTRD